MSDVIEQKQHPLKILRHTYEESEPRYGNTDAYATVVNFGREVIIECFKQCTFDTALDRGGRDAVLFRVIYQIFKADMLHFPD